jgi:4-hydroxybenzoyl-CoA reductase subunit beta
MRLKPFAFYRPDSLAEAFEIMSACEPGSFALMGGGTDTLIKMKQRLLVPQSLISLRGIPELTQMAQEGRDVFIGAGVTLNSLEDSALIQSLFPSLAQAAGGVGSPQLRNMGTIGGNIHLDTRCLYFNQLDWPGGFSPCFKRGGDRCHVVKKGTRCYALFCADTPAVLLIYDARICIAGPDGERECPIDEFYQDDGLSCCRMEENELIKGIKLTVRPHLAGRYSRFSTRGAIDFPLVGIAVAVEKNSGEKSLNFRVAATGIQSRPLRLRNMEESLTSGVWPREMTETELQDGVKEIKMVRHHGLSPSYRQELLKVLIERALKELECGIIN